jgi:hypothetical protein
MRSALPSVASSGLAETPDLAWALPKEASEATANQLPEATADSKDPHLPLRSSLTTTTGTAHAAGADLASLSEAGLAAGRGHR